MIKRVKLTIKGRVQGVGFRFFTKYTAFKLGLKGHVKNLYNGDVEIVAEGTEEKLKNLVEACQKGTFLSRVEDIDIKYEKATGEFTTFSIQY